MLKKYVDLVLGKIKKPIGFDKIVEKINNLLLKEDELFNGLTVEDKKDIENILNEGVLKYNYIKTQNDNYISIFKTSFRKGRFHGNRNGDGNVLVVTSYTNGRGTNIVNKNNYSISRENSNGAIDGDIVLIDTKLGGDNKIVEILERHLETIMGEVYKIGNSYFVKPVDKKKQAITIALEEEAIEGSRVAVTLKEQTGDNFYIGNIERIFNHKDDPDEDILWEAFKYGIDDQFSKESREQIEMIPQVVRDMDTVGRCDFRNWEIFTIDGEDTKDIDDAISCKIASTTNNYILGVHIADVSYYVPKNSPLDLDAFRKGTSNYLAGKVIPMLPHELSNGICSLNPDVDRLALSCIMEITPAGEIVNHSIVQSIIHSNIKMTYDKVNDILKNNNIPPEYEKHANTLNLLNKLALTLRKKRIQDGAVEFGRGELKLVYDEDGKVVDFSIRNQDFAENLIEECMLAANETVDKHLSSFGFPCLHRVHDKPNPDKLTDYFRLLEAVNYPFYKYSPEECVANSKALQKLAEHIKHTGRISNMLTIGLVQCMSRAKYSPNNIGHRGLAKDNYCHFTSPIRRYPDLTIHRLLKDLSCSNNNKKENLKKQWNLELPEIGEHSSLMEKQADKAEEITLLMKCSEYMQNHIGEEFEGTIVGLSQNGIKIQLDNLIEGKVRLRNLDGEYVFNPDTFSLVALDKGENYYLGDRLLLKLVNADKDSKLIDFKVIKKREENYMKDSSDSNQYIKSFTKNERAMRNFKNS